MKTLPSAPLWSVCQVIGLLAVGGCSFEPLDEAPAEEGELAEVSQAIGGERGYIKAKGAFTCDFRLAGDYPQNEVAPDLERDRMLMSSERGVQQKLIPMRLDFEHFTNGMPDLLSGGRYLFNTWADARKYEHFVENEYALDGEKFFERPRFFDPECHAFKVVAAYDFGDIHTEQVIMRTERFSMPQGGVRNLKKVWPAILAEAGDRGFSSVWLLHSDIVNLASLVYLHDRIVPRDPFIPDFASLGYVEGSPGLGHHISSLGWPQTFDRTSWVFTIWYPFKPGDHGEPSDWPHSPPFAQPFCSDGVCEVSRGENHATCPADCVEGCGDAVCTPDEGESFHACPGDCDTENRSHTCAGGTGRR